MRRNIILIALACVFLSGCLPDEETKANPEESGFARVVIADRVFKIPKGYFDGRKATGKNTESVVLEYSLPDFEVLPKHPEEREARQELLKEGRMRGMLLENATKRPSFDIAVTNLMRGRDFKKEGLIYGLEKYTHIVPKAVRPEPEYKPYHQDDFFIERNADGSVKSYLRCSPPGKDKTPSCRHRFVDKGLLYNTHWRIQELPRWQEQRNAEINFIDSFEVKEGE